MKKRVLLIVFVLALVAALVGCTTQTGISVEPDEELLTNGNFEQTKPDAGWTYVKTGESGSATFPYTSSASGSYSEEHGQNYLSIVAESSKTCITYFTQSVKVQPHCVYVLSVDYRVPTTIAVGDGGKGAYLMLDGFKYMYRAATDATDDWQTWQLYFNSDDYDEVTVKLGLGEADYTVTGGSVYFDNVSLKRLSDEEAVGVAAVALSSANSSNLPYNAAYRISNVDVVFTVLIVVLTAILLVAAYFVLRRLAARKVPAELEEGKTPAPTGKGKFFKSTTFLMIVTLLVGFGMRLVLSLTMYGYGAWENAVMTNTMAMVENGLADYYFNYATFYAPGTMYVLYILGLIAVPLKLAAGTQGLAIFLKIPAIIADLLLIAIVFLSVDKRKGSLWAFVVSMALALCPVVYMASSVWGVYTSVAVLFLVLTFMAVRQKAVIRMTVFYFFAVMFAEESLLLLPLLIVFAVLLYIKYPETRMKLPISATVALVVGYGLTVPLAVNFFVAGHPFIVLERLCTTFNQNDYFARNVFNIYAMCAVGAKTVNNAGVVMSAIFAALAMLGGIVMYLKGRNRQDIILYAAWTLLAVYTLCVRLNLWVMLSGLVLLYLYVLYTEEKRLMWVVGALTVIGAVNACYVMAVGGNVKGGVGAAGVTVGSTDPVAIVFSALLVLAFLGLTYVVVDICLGRKKIIMPLTNSPREWLKKTFNEQEDK